MHAVNDSDRRPNATGDDDDDDFVHLTNGQTDVRLCSSLPLFICNTL